MNKPIIRSCLTWLATGGCGGTVVSLMTFLVFGVNSPFYVLMIPGVVLSNAFDKSGGWGTVFFYLVGSLIGWVILSGFAFFIYYIIKSERESH